LQEYRRKQYERGVCVVRRKGETTEELIKRFKKKFSKSGLIKEIRQHMFYEKPSEKRRRKRAQARRARQKEIEKIEKNRQRLRRLRLKKKRKEQWKSDTSSTRQSVRKTYGKRKDK